MNQGNSWKFASLPQPSERHTIESSPTANPCTDIAELGINCIFLRSYLHNWPTLLHWRLQHNAVSIMQSLWLISHTVYYRKRFCKANLTVIVIPVIKFSKSFNILYISKLKFIWTLKISKKNVVSECSVLPFQVFLHKSNPYLQSHHLKIAFFVLSCVC